MSADPKSDAIYKAVLILLDSMSHEQRMKVEKRLLDRGMSLSAPKPAKAPIKKRSRPAS